MELLVVMGIIAILGGLSMVGVRTMLKHAHISAEEHAVTMLKSSITTFGQEWGEFPPTSLSALSIKSGAGTNEGNESLFACLLARKQGGPFAEDLDESKWQNYDGDKLSAPDLKKIREKLDWVRTSDLLLEYTDFWGNPYVYIHNSNYGKTYRYVDLEGNTVEVKAAKNSTTGEYAAPTSFQLWSFGHDGINENGGGDDICSWQN